MPEIESYDQIEIRSQEVQEVLGSTPNWVLRSGIGAVFLVLIILLTGSWFFKYPDVVNAPVVLTTKNPPVNLKAFATGNIAKLFVNDKQKVKSGTLIAIIDNPADYDSVVSLKMLLDTLSSDSLMERHHGMSGLGGIQSAYNAYCKASSDWQGVVNLNYHEQKREGIRTQIAGYHSYLIRLETQEELKGKELHLQQVQYDRNANLYSESVISKSELERSEQNLLQQKIAYENIRSNIANTQMQIAQLQQEILDVQLAEKNEMNTLKSQIELSYNALLTAIDTWEKSYVIRTPVDGMVSMPVIWSENQSIVSGELVATVLPEEEADIIGRIRIPAGGAGKVQIGQRVNIKLDHYPHMEYGMMTTKVKSISDMPVVTDRGVYYTAELEIADTMVSSYQKELEFSQEMTGSAEIITENIRLLERVLYPLKSLLKKNIEE